MYLKSQQRTAEAQLSDLEFFQDSFCLVLEKCPNQHKGHLFSYGLIVFIMC